MQNVIATSVLILLYNSYFAKGNTPCPRVEPDVNVVVHYDDAAHTRAIFECRRKWYLMVGNKISYCSNGIWVPTPPKCEVRCKNPRHPKYGTAHHNGLKPGSTLTYKCNENFVLSENDTRVCTRFGLWSRKDPHCIASACEKPADPFNGKVLYVSLKVGAKLAYECDEGFSLQANVVRECTREGTWSGEDPHCEEIVCDDPVKPKGGKVELTGNDKRIGSTAKFSCNPGTTLFGSSSTTCTEDGKWDSDVPMCIKDCDQPPSIDGTIVSKDMKEPYSVNSTVSYECTRGYVSRGGNARAVCVIDSETKKSVWTIPNIICVPISCGNPGNVQDGRREGDDFTYPNSVVYTCNEGYRLHGKSTLDCQDNGRWNNKIPSCKALLCDIPRNPSKGTALYDSVEFGSKLKYVCDDGFSLNDIVERTCLSNGLWSGQEPICEAVVCNFPEVPVGGKVDFKDEDRRYGSTVDFECDPGKTLVGSHTLTCLNTGQWSSESPMCLESCTVPIIQNGSLGLGGFALAQEAAADSTVDHGTELILKCDEGFESQKQQSSITKLTCDDGKWSSEPQCNPAHCQKAPPALVNGDIVKYDKDHDSVAVYKCNNFYKLVDKGIIVCKYGTWKGKLPVCEDARCYTKSLSNIPGLILDRKEFFSSGESFTPSCSEEYEISDTDDVKIYCIEGKWSGNLTPCTEKMVCGNLEAPSEGNIEMIGGRRTVGSSAVFTCNPGRKLVGNSTSKCMENGEWTSEPPECLKPCTVPLVGFGSLATSVKNGSFIYFQEGASVEAGTELIFRCNRKYYLPNFNDTEFRVTCKKGQLPSDLRCTPEKCHDAPPPIMNGYIEHFEDQHNGVVVYKCNNFFSFEDIGSIACDFGIWKGKLPVCKYTRCYMRSLSNTPGLLIDEKRIFDSGQSFTPQCRDSYEVSEQGDGKIYCDKGEWTGNIPPCEETSCTEPPPEPENGKAVQYTGKNGTAVVYRCDDSFIMEENSIVQCLYRNWEGMPPICKDTRCHMNTLSKYPGTLVDEKRFIFNGQSFTPTCSSGYQISWNGNGRIYCNEGEWTGNLPPCKEEMCTVPFVPNGSIGEDEKNGRFINYKKVSEGTAVEHGTELTFRCDINYELVDENAEPKIICNKGKWSRDLQCTPAHCRKVPPGILNGYVENFEETHDSAPSYKCNEFFRLTDNGSIVCQFGSWKGNLPICEDTRCYTKSLKDLAGLSQEILAQRDFFSSGESFAPACTEMYEVSTQDDVNIYCTDGKWTGNLPPCTERIVCDDPEDPVGGKVEVIGGKRTVGSSAVFTCNPGRKLVGPSTSTCLDTGHWSSNAPQCLKPCTVPLVPYGSFGLESNGSMMYFQEVAAQTNVEPGTELLFRCERNYDIEDQDNSELKVICENEKFPADLKCVPAKCRDAPPPLPNGFIEKFEDIHEGEVIYKCNDFFKLEDSGSLKCQFGEWKGKLPICKDIRCYMNTLSDLPGLLINQKKFLHNGQSFLPKCTDTYEVSKKDDDKIYCTDGEWTGNIPPCEEKGCKDPPPEPENGEALQYTGVHGTSVVYSCNMWYKMEGNSKVECLNRQWIGTPPICRETRCFMRSLSEYSGILIDEKDFAQNGQSLTPKCDDGYVINPQRDVRIYCTEGQWSGNLPPCKEADCVDPPPEPENGRATNYSGKHGTSVTYECNEHFFIEDPNRNAECSLGKWKGKTPTCKDTRCYLKNLRNNEGVQLEDDNPTMPNEKASVTCEEGYIMTFSPPTCLRGEWKNGRRFSPCQQAGCKVEMVENGVTKVLGRNVKERPNVKLEDDDFFIIDVESWKKSGDNVFVFCEPPYTFLGRGDPGYAKITCEKGKWRPLPLCLLTEITTTTIVTTNPTCECIYNTFGRYLVANLDERPLKYGDKVPSGLVITFQCTDTDHYRLTGPREIICENCGWDSAFPVCEEIESRLMCPEIPEDESIIIQYNGNRKVGSTANFWCMKIESQRIGPEGVTCLPTGQWSEKPPTCRDLSCPEIPIVPFMAITYEGNRQINSIARFQCKIPESQRIGPHFITCEPTGKWSGRPPTCIGFCPEIKEDESLIITYHGERHINSTTSFRCKDPEFQRVGPGFVTCLISGRWSDNPPKCEEIFCPGIAVDNSVQVIYNGDKKIYSTASFLCTNPDTEINGPITVSCLQNGKWSQAPPTCEYLVCPELAVDDSVQVTYSDDRNIQSTASFHCTNPDTEVIGPVTVSCLQNGIWSEEPPKCEYTSCPEIEAQKLVQITYNGERKIYSTVSFQCKNPNTKIVGPVTASCLENAKWSKEPPTCEYVFCPEIPVEDSVKVIYNAARSIYSTASFLCRNPNSEIVGPVTVSCLQNGKWSQDPPTCKYIFCPEIPVDDSVTVIYNAERNIYSTASFKCGNSESKIKGPRTVSCEPSGEWSEKPPTCENLFCPEIEVIDGMEVIYNSGREIYSTASFRCSSPEQIIDGPTFASCQPSGMWSENSPTCKYSYCPELRLDNSVIASYSSGRKVSSVASFRCSNVQAKIKGPNTITCLPSGEWAEEPPKCEPKDNSCPEIVIDDSIIVTYTSDRRPFSKAEFRCSDPGMVISGFVQITCLLTGKWSDPVPTCKRRDAHCEKLPCPDSNGSTLPTKKPSVESKDFLCPEIETDDLVKVIYTSKRRLYSKAEFHCLDPYMVISGSIRVSCLSTGKWSGPAPTCQISECEPGAVICQDGSCVESDKRCDGNNDCPDARDENDCDAECPEIFPRSGLTISYKTNRQIWGKARFQCTYPLQRIGNETITCLPTRKWSAPIPSCYPISMVCFVKSLVEQLHANMELADKEQSLDKVLLDSEVHLKCHISLSDVKKSAKATCQKNGKWKIGDCVSGCVPFKKPAKSSLIINNEKTSYILGDSLTFTCPEGKHLTSALQRVFCLNGGWSDTILPTCEDIGASWLR